MPEQHGSGPAHFAAEKDGIVIELYPGDEGAAPDPRAGGATMLGFRVASLEDALAALRALGMTPPAAKESPEGRWASVRDPDGRVVRLEAGIAATTTPSPPARTVSWRYAVSACSAP